MRQLIRQVTDLVGAATRSGVGDLPGYRSRGFSQHHQTVNPADILARSSSGSPERQAQGQKVQETSFYCARRPPTGQVTSADVALERGKSPVPWWVENGAACSQIILLPLTPPRHWVEDVYCTPILCGGFHASSPAPCSRGRGTGSGRVRAAGLGRGGQFPAERLTGTADGRRSSHAGSRGRNRRSGRVDRSGRQPGRYRRPQARRQRHRRGGGGGQHAGRDATFRGRARGRRLHGHLPGQEPPGRHHRRPGDVPQRLHTAAVPGPEHGGAVAVRVGATLGPVHRGARPGRHLDDRCPQVRAQHLRRRPAAGDSGR